MGPADRLQYITNMLMFIYVPSFLPQMYTFEKPRVLQPHPNICNHLWTETACHLSLGFQCTLQLMSFWYFVFSKETNMFPGKPHHRTCHGYQFKEPHWLSS